MSILTRVPYDSQYTALVGQAVYVFAYYEWVVIYLIQQFKPDFVNRYSRGAPMTSGAVKKELAAIIADTKTNYTTVTKADLDACLLEFTSLIDKRNALIHAHPVTNHDGSQILSYQARIDRALPDMKWPVVEVETAISAFDAAACSANQLLQRLLK